MLPILPPDFEARTLDHVRRATDDIAECDAAEIDIFWQGQVPFLRFIFSPALASRMCGSPACALQLTAESRSNPLAVGRLLTLQEIERHARNTIDKYLAANGVTITRKVLPCLSTESA